MCERETQRMNAEQCYTDGKSLVDRKSFCPHYDNRTTQALKATTQKRRDELEWDSEGNN